MNFGEGIWRGLSGLFRSRHPNSYDDEFLPATEPQHRLILDRENKFDPLTSQQNHQAYMPINDDSIPQCLTPSPDLSSASPHDVDELFTPGWNLDENDSHQPAWTHQQQQQTHSTTLRSDDLVSVLLQQLATPELLAALVNIRRTNRHPVEVNEHSTTEAWTIAGILALCRRAGISPYEVDSELVLTVLWIMLSWNRQDASQPSVAASFFLKLRPPHHHDGRINREALTNTLLAEQIPFLKRCNFIVMLDENNDLHPALADLQVHTHLHQLCNHIYSEGLRCAQQAPHTRCWVAPFQLSQSPSHSLGLENAGAVAEVSLQQELEDTLSSPPKAYRYNDFGIINNNVNNRAALREVVPWPPAQHHHQQQQHNFTAAGEDFVVPPPTALPPPLPSTIKVPTSSKKRSRMDDNDSAVPPLQPRGLFQGNIQPFPIKKAKVQRGDSSSKDFSSDIFGSNRQRKAAAWPER